MSIRDYLGIFAGGAVLMDNQDIKYAGEARQYIGTRIEVHGPDTVSAMKEADASGALAKLEDGAEIPLLFTAKELVHAAKRASLARNRIESESLSGGLADFFD